MHLFTVDFSCRSEKRGNRGEEVDEYPLDSGRTSEQSSMKTQDLQTTFQPIIKTLEMFSFHVLVSRFVTSLKTGICRLSNVLVILIKLLECFVVLLFKKN